jgi:NAD(P)-dependent dehydrogenase (short-subunit alcohol dehydrogenase family)
LGTLDGRVAIVTGGARGIGRAYCLGLAREGARVVSADLSDSAAVVNEIEGAGGAAIGVEVDVTSQQATENLAAKVIERFGQIDILVNNAGYMTNAAQLPFEEFDVDEWDKVFAINVRGSWLCAKAVTPHMRARKYGRIINVSSMTVVDGTPTLTHYVSSKAAIIGLTRGMARELGDDNIAVNTVTPDYIPHDSKYADRQPPGQGDWIIARRCFKREETPEDMVGVVVFLSGPGADFITGQNIAVNGGSAFL